MRSLLVLVAVAGAFLFAVVRPHREAAELVRGENEALRLLPDLARAGPAESRVESGYSFEWRRSADAPPLLVARPVRQDVDGVRWFATLGGDRIYERDSVALRVEPVAPGDFPLLARHLSRPDDPAAPRPPGWKPLVR